MRGAAQKRKIARGDELRIACSAARDHAKTPCRYQRGRQGCDELDASR
jgi:hypothetical protein